MSVAQVFANPLSISKFKRNQPIDTQLQGKIYADIPLNFFTSIETLKNYIVELKNLGVNTVLILPHFMPGLSAYVVKDYELPCPLFETWEKFSEFMLFVKGLNMDRMIDIPLNHADWNADNLKREWYVKHTENGIEAGADDEDADRNRVRINWGAFILDNSNQELISYWLEKVIFPHIEKMNVNAIRIDAAWGLDSKGLKTLISETKKRYPNVWFLAENLGMDKLINLAKSALDAGADRFFNNIFWYNGGIGIPSDIYRLYKRSNGVPTCSIYSSHDTLMPAMKALTRIKPDEVSGMNDKAVVRKFVQYDNIKSIKQLDFDTQNAVIEQMKLDFALIALMTSDVMFAAGSEKALFERIDVLASNADSFSRGIESDLPAFMNEILQIKASDIIFNNEGVIIPFGSWQSDESGLKGYIKSIPEKKHAIVAVNTGKEPALCRIPSRIKNCNTAKIFSPSGYYQIDVASLPDSVKLDPGQIIILSAEGKNNDY